MTVYRGYMAVVKRNLSQMFLYLGIFVGIIILIQSFTPDTVKGNFQATKLNIAVVDRDGGTLAKGMTKYLEKHHKLVNLPDEKQRLQEELFYRNVSYIVFIPENFEESCIKNSEKLETTKVPGSYDAFYVDQQIQTFLNQIRVYESAGYDMDEAVETVIAQSDIKTEVHLEDKSGNGGMMAEHVSMFQYFPYLFIAVLCYSLSTVIIVFRDREIKRRMLCAPVSYFKQNVSAILAFLTVGIAFWGISMLLPIAFYAKEFLADPHLGLLLLNTLVLLVVSLALAYFVGMIAKNTVAVNGITNVLALGMSFLCGVFVPMYMLGDGVKKVAQFLPIYWYEQINNTLGSYAVLTESMYQEIYKGLGIQLIFAAACICVGLVVGKRRE